MNERLCIKQIRERFKYIKERELLFMRFVKEHRSNFEKYIKMYISLQKIISFTLVKISVVQQMERELRIKIVL